MDRLSLSPRKHPVPLIRLLSKKSLPSSNALSANTARFYLRSSVCRPFQQPNSNATSIPSPLRSNGRGSSFPTPGSIIHQKTPITFSSSIQLPSPAASPASFIVSGTDLLQFSNSTISPSLLTIFPISKTGYPNHCCLWVQHSLPHRLLITVIPTALLIRSNASHHPLPIIIQGEWVGVLFVGHEERWRRRGRTNRHQKVSSDRRRNHYRNARQQQHRSDVVPARRQGNYIRQFRQKQAKFNQRHET